MDLLRLLVLAVVGAVVVFGVALSVRGIVAEMRYRRTRRRGPSKAGAEAVGADIDTALTNFPAPTPVRAASAIVVEWAAGRRCAVCGRSLPEAARASHRTALLDPSGATSDWSDIPVDRLPLALATSLPVCWHCHTAELFRRLHPELVTDRDEGTTRPTNP
ncbi:MAG: hypothetical protein ABMA15_23480 [Vicinamibacterales bacterium]